MDQPVEGSSQVKVIFNSLSSGKLNAPLIASVNSLYPSGPGLTSKEYVLLSKFTFIIAGASAPQIGVRTSFQLGRCESQNSHLVSRLQDHMRSVLEERKKPQKHFSLGNFHQSSRTVIFPIKSQGSSAGSRADQLTLNQLIAIANVLDKLNVRTCATQDQDLYTARA